MILREFFEKKMIDGWWIYICWKIFYISAAASEDIETLQAYRDAGANLSVCDYDKRTALHVVSSF